MIFALIRLMPVLAGLAHLSLVGVTIWAYQYWYVWLVVNVLLIVSWSALIAWRRRDWHVIPLGLYLLVYVLIGLAFTLLIGSQIGIVAFVVIWSLLLAMVLESSFHYIYQTTTVDLVNLRYILHYVNIVLVFLGTAAVANVTVFLGILTWPAAVAIVFGGGLILTGVYLLIYDRRTWHDFVLAVIVALVLAELVGALLWWPVSFHVTAILTAVAYYWLTAIISAVWEGRYDITVLRRHSLVAGALIAMTLITANWL